MPSNPVKITVQVEGLADLEQALTELPKATAKNTIRRALVAAAQPIVDEATQLIRVRRVQPSIAVSKIKFTTENAGKAAFAEAMQHGATREEAGQAAHAANAATDDDPKMTSGVAVIGPTRRAFYGFEFGTIHQAPQPFMRPAWDLHKEEALRLIQTELATQIEKARLRLVMKQLRLLAAIQSK
jgi:HK97 gp10 family phage protein